MKAIAIAALLLSAAPALAQPAGPADERPVPAPGVPAAEPKINQLIVYGDDACPASSDAEIIVCARKPEGERYRIPENLRELGTTKTESWANQATELSYVGASGTDSCSTAGAGGMTGCLTRIINRAAAERQNTDAIDWDRLIEEARQARLGTIDARSEEIEREVTGQPPR